MTPFTTIVARAAVLDRANVDTDQIIPARFLKEPREVGYGQFLFHDLPDLRAKVLGAGILFAGDNFGCGSSREGAVYALLDAGIRCVVAPSFGDIFAGNAVKNGLLLLALPESETAALRAGAGDLTVDLAAQVLQRHNARIEFAIDPFRKRMLLEGLDETGLTLAHDPELQAWADHDALARPWLVPPTLMTM